MPVDEMVDTGADTGFDNTPVDNGNYVSEVLLGPDAPQEFGSDETRTSDRTQPATQTDKTGQVEKTEEPTEDAKPQTELEKLIAKYAKDTGLNPNDPGQRKALKIMADQEAYVQRLKGERGRTGAVDDKHLTELEKSLLQTEKPGDVATKPAEVAQTRTDAAPGPIMLGDVSDAWFKTADPVKAAYDDLNAAWAANDVNKVASVEAGMWGRRFMAIGMPVIRAMAQREAKQLVEAHFKEQVQPLLGDVQPLIDQRNEDSSRDQALEQLSRVPDFAEVGKLLEPDQDGTIEIDGMVFPNNPLNRIVLGNPWLMNIKRDHADPRTAAILTKMDTYRAAMSIYQKENKPQGIDPANAAALVDAGKQVARRTAADKARHGVNAGNGAGRGPQGDQSYVESLNNGAGKPTSFGSLFS